MRSPAWSITMVSTIHHLPPTTPLFYMSLFAFGALIMRGAGCTINDMWDRRIDLAVGTHGSDVIWMAAVIWMVS